MSTPFRLFALLAPLLLGCSNGDPAGVCAPPVARPSGLLIAGSGSNLALVREIAARWQQLHPDKPVHVPESIGTGGAVRALQDGAIELGLGSRPLKESEKLRGVLELPLARTPLALVVSPAAGVDALTTDELAAILRGERRTWPNGVPIVPLLREPGDSGNELLIQTFPALGVALKAALRTGRFEVAFTDQEMRDALHSIPGAIGFLDLGIVRLEGLSLQVVRLDGVAPPEGAGASASGYPLIKTLTFLSRGAPTGDAADFVAFARGPESAAILARAGLLPIEEPAP